LYGVGLMAEEKLEEEAMEEEIVFLKAGKLSSG
jgi:hypothetical protein